MHRTASLFVLAAAAAAYAAGAPWRTHDVTISPTSIYLSSHDRTATIELFDGADRPVDLDLSIAFGYPVSDSLGRVSVRLMDVVPADEPSAVAWLSVSPRRVSLAPRQHQTVHVASVPPSTLPPGEYWARLVVRPHAEEHPAELVNTQAGRPSATGGSVVDSVLGVAVSYRNGPVATGVQVDEATAHTTDSTASLTLDLSRTGNAAYLGRVVVEMLTTRGLVVAQTSDDVAVYRSLRRIFMFRVPSGSASTFRYRLSTQRDDIDSALIMRSEPISGQVRFAP